MCGQRVPIITASFWALHNSTCSIFDDFTHFNFRRKSGLITVIWAAVSTTAETLTFPNDTGTIILTPCLSVHVNCRTILGFAAPSCGNSACSEEESPPHLDEHSVSGITRSVGVPANKSPLFLSLAFFDGTTCSSGSVETVSNVVSVWETSAPAILWPTSSSSGMAARSSKPPRPIFPTP